MGPWKRLNRAQSHYIIGNNQTAHKQFIQQEFEGRIDYEIFNTIKQREFSEALMRLGSIRAKPFSSMRKISSQKRERQNHHHSRPINLVACNKNARVLQ